MWPAPLTKVLIHVANIDKNKGLIEVIRANMKPELTGQCITNGDLCVVFFGTYQLWELGRTETPTKQVRTLQNGVHEDNFIHIRPERAGK